MMHEDSVGTACDQALAEIIADVLSQSAESAVEIAQSWPGLQGQPSHTAGTSQEVEEQHPSMGYGTAFHGAAHKMHDSTSGNRRSASSSYAELHDMHKSYDLTHTISGQHGHAQHATSGHLAETEQQQQYQQQQEDLSFEQRLVTPPPIALGDDVMRDLERQEAALQEELALEAEQAEMKRVKEEWALDQALRDAGVYTAATAPAAQGVSSSEEGVYDAKESEQLQQGSDEQQVSVQEQQQEVQVQDVQSSEDDAADGAAQLLSQQAGYSSKPGEAGGAVAEGSVEDQSGLQQQLVGGAVQQQDRSAEGPHAESQEATLPQVDSQMAGLPRVDSQEMMHRAAALDSPLASARRVTGNPSDLLIGHGVAAQPGVEAAVPYPPERLDVGKQFCHHLYEQLYPPSPDFPPPGTQTASGGMPAAESAAVLPHQQTADGPQQSTFQVASSAALTNGTLPGIGNGISSGNNTAAVLSSTFAAELTAGALQVRVAGSRGVQDEQVEGSFRFMVQDGIQQAVGSQDGQQTAAAGSLQGAQGQSTQGPSQDADMVSSWDTTSDAYYAAQQERSRHIAEQLAKLQEESRLLQEKSRVLQEQASAIQKETGVVVPRIAPWHPSQIAATTSGPAIGLSQVNGTVQVKNKGASPSAVTAAQSQSEQLKSHVGVAGSGQRAGQGAGRGRGGGRGGRSTQGSQSARAMAASGKQDEQLQGQQQADVVPGTVAAATKLVNKHNNAQHEVQLKGLKPKPKQLSDNGIQSDPGTVASMIPPMVSPEPSAGPPPSFSSKPALTWGLPKKPGFSPPPASYGAQAPAASRALPPLIHSASPDVLPHHGYPSQVHHTSGVSTSHSDGAELRRENSSSSTIEPLLPRWSDQVSTANNSPVTSPYRHLRRFHSPLKTHPSPDSKQRLEKAAGKAKASPPEAQLQAVAVQQPPPAALAVQQQQQAMAVQQQQQRQRQVGFAGQEKQGHDMTPVAAAQLGPTALPAGNGKPRKFLPEVRLPLLLQPSAANQNSVHQAGAAALQSHQTWGGPQQLQPLPHDVAQRMHVTWDAAGAAAPAQAMPGHYNQQMYMPPQQSVKQAAPMQMYTAGMPNGAWQLPGGAFHPASGMDMGYSPISGAYMQPGPLPADYSSGSIGVDRHARPVPHKAGGGTSGGVAGQSKTARVRHAAGKASQANPHPQHGPGGARHEEPSYIQGMSMAPQNTYLPPIHVNAALGMYAPGVVYGQVLGMGMQQMGMPGMAPVAGPPPQASGHQANAVKHTPRQHDALKQGHAQLPPVGVLPAHWPGMMYQAPEPYSMYGAGHMPYAGDMGMYPPAGVGAQAPAWQMVQPQVAAVQPGAKRQSKPGVGKPAFRTY